MPESESPVLRPFVDDVPPDVRAALEERAAWMAVSAAFASLGRAFVAPLSYALADMNKVLLAILLAMITNTYAGEYEHYWDSWHQNSKLIEQQESRGQVLH